MSSAPQPHDRDSNFAFWSRVIAFALGVVILLYQMIIPDPNYLMIGVGAGCLGPVTAQSVATVLDSIRGGGSG